VVFGRRPSWAIVYRVCSGSGGKCAGYFGGLGDVSGGHGSGNHFDWKSE